MSPATTDDETARRYLELTQLLDRVEREHPAVSATLRLTLVRSRRRHRDGWLDAERFREVVLELTALGALAPELAALDPGDTGGPWGLRAR